MGGKDATAKMQICALQLFKPLELELSLLCTSCLGQNRGPSVECHSAGALVSDSYSSRFHNSSSVILQDSVSFFNARFDITPIPACLFSNKTLQAFALDPRFVGLVSAALAVGSVTKVQFGAPGAFVQHQHKSLTPYD